MLDLFREPRLRPTANANELVRLPQIHCVQVLIALAPWITPPCFYCFVIAHICMIPQQIRTLQFVIGKPRRILIYIRRRYCRSNCGAITPRSCGSPPFCGPIVPRRGDSLQTWHRPQKIGQSICEDLFASWPRPAVHPSIPASEFSAVPASSARPRENGLRRERPESSPALAK